MKKDIKKIREIAERRLDRVMASINPNIGFSIGLDGVAYLADLKNHRLILDREPDERELAALAAYTIEIELRASDEFQFELDNVLYMREVYDDCANYVRYKFNPNAIKWDGEIISLESFILISNFVQARSVSEEDRAARAKEDMARLKDTMEKKPDSVKE